CRRTAYKTSWPSPKMSAVTSTRSPMVRLMGKRPQSTSGRTPSITTFLANVGLTALFSEPVVCPSAVAIATAFLELSVRAIPSYRQKRETTRAERAAAKVLNNQIILEIYHRNSGPYFEGILSSGDESDD